MPINRKQYKNRLIGLLLMLFIFVFLKIWYRNAGNHDLYFLLKPAATVSSILHNATILEQDNGSLYLYPLHVQLEKSCSGFNFALLCFLALALPAVWHSQKTANSILMVLLSLLMALPLTVLVNSFRIYVSVYTQLLGNLWLPVRPHYIIHDITGMSVHFLFLILIFYLWNHYILAKLNHGKTA